MKRIFVFTCTLLLFSFQCDPEIEFEDNKRLLVKGRLTTSTGEPFENFPIQVLASRNSSIFDVRERLSLNQDELIGLGKTGEDGTFSITTLSPRNESSIYLIANTAKTGPINPGFGALVIDFINELGNLHSTEFALGQIELDSVQRFELSVSRSPEANDTIFYDFRYKGLNTYISFSSEAYLGFNEIFDGGQLLPNEELKTNIFEVRVGDTLFLDYRRQNVSILEEGNLQIPITGNDESFTLGF